MHLVHGSPLALNDFWWESLPAQEHRARVAASGAQVICCTHSGLPWQRRVDGTLVVNVGVLGKPANDGRREVWYALLDLEDGHAQAQLIRLDYDWAAQAASMRAAQLPEPFVETIETGWWTTCLESLPPAERSRGRYHLYRSLTPTGFAPAAGGWGDDAAGPAEFAGDERPVIPLFGSAYFPPRLWVYTNFHCNLACDYCAVASSPKVDPRALTLPAFLALVDEAQAEGFTELYLTGGEPLMHPDLLEMLRYAADRLPTVLLTNAMLLRGRKLDMFARLAGHPNLTVQSSLDGARAATHDAHRGRGSFAATVSGIRHLHDLGVAFKVALTETPENSTEIPAVRRLLADLGLPDGALAIRPLLRRGVSGDGINIGAETTVPELTVTADALAWHPAGADAATSPDMQLAPAGTPLAEGKRLVVERFFAERLADGTMPQPYRCAV